MFISRNIYSPNFRIPGNTTDRSPGFYAHTPKYWNCRDHDFSNGWMKFQRDVSEGPPEGWAEHEREQRARHEHCRWPYRHLSYSGYVCYVFPNKGRLTFWYWGRSPNPTQRRLDWQPDYQRRYNRRVYKIDGA